MPQAAIGENPLLANSQATNSTPGIVSQVLPGAAGLTSSAATNTQNLLSGLPSTSAARKANAVFGANSGMAPGSDFLKTRLYDTYGKEVDARNQLGLQNFLALISGLSGPELASRGQENQKTQFGQSLAQQQQQFADNLKQRQEEFNKSNDLALAQFGFNRSRYYQDKANPKSLSIGNIPGDVLGAGQANMSLEQNNASNPQWWY